jgi:hypothetical protein
LRLRNYTTEMTLKQDQLWTTKSLADAAGVSGTYIRRLLLSGKLDGTKLGRDWAITHEAAQKFLDRKDKRKK